MKARLQVLIMSNLLYDALDVSLDEEFYSLEPPLLNEEFNAYLGGPLIIGGVLQSIILSFSDSSFALLVVICGIRFPFIMSNRFFYGSIEVI